MFHNAKNGTLKIDDIDMEYISFGNGGKPLVMIPGVGDGLKTVKGYAVPFSLLYSKYAKGYKVYVFSRKNRLPEGSSTRDMAKDLRQAMLQLNIKKADIIGVSQGGMIAQYLAIDYPGIVNKLVLAVTLARPNETVTHVVSNWIKMAKAGDYKSLFVDTAEKSYSEKYLRKNRWFYPIITKFGKPKDFSRFIVMANACITHNSYHELGKIVCPTLVIGGDSDKIVTGKASEEIAEGIAGSHLFMYKGLGHGVYEEAKDFNNHVLDFLTQ